MSLVPTGPETKIDSAGEDQQQLTARATRLHHKCSADHVYCHVFWVCVTIDGV
jgi:hypothetical protein